MNKVIFPFLLFINRNFAIGKYIYLSQKGKISFNSSVFLNDSEMEYYEAASLLNTRTGDFNFAALLENFYHSLTETRRFNLNAGPRAWLKSIFKGTIVNNSLSGIDFNKDGYYPIEVEGDLSIQEISKKIYTTGTIRIERGVIRAQSMILFHPYEFNIDRSYCADRISSQGLEMSIDLAFESKT